MFDSSKNLCAWTDPDDTSVTVANADGQSVYYCNYVEPVMTWQVSWSPNDLTLPIVMYILLLAGDCNYLRGDRRAVLSHRHGGRLHI
jgi:hypothetical protein